MGPQNAINEILDKVNKIPLEDQGLLLELIRNRYHEKRRDEILANAHQSEEEYKKGLTSNGSFSDLLREMEAW